MIRACPPIAQLESQLPQPHCRDVQGQERPDRVRSESCRRQGAPRQTLGKIGNATGEGVLAEAKAIAVKRVIAFQLEELMKEQKPTKTQLAKRMSTSRSATTPAGK